MPQYLFRFMLLEIRLEEHVVIVEIRLRDFWSAGHLTLQVVLFHELLD
jgi:hypothetical protein